MINEFLDEFDDLLASLPGETENLSDLRALVERQIQLSELKEKVEDLLKTVNNEFREVSEIQIPDMFAELQLSELTLENGHKVRVQPYVTAKIRDPKIAFEWLEKNNLDDIIKAKVDVAFGNSSYQDAITLAEALANEGYPVTVDRNIHPQTLKAFVRHALEDNLPLPLDAFGVYVGRKTTIK